MNINPREGSIRIIIDDGKFEVYVNGIRLKGLKKVELTAGINEVANLKLELFPPGSIPTKKLPEGG